MEQRPIAGNSAALTLDGPRPRGAHGFVLIAELEDGRVRSSRCMRALYPMIGRLAVASSRPELPRGSEGCGLGDAVTVQLRICGNDGANDYHKRGSGCQECLDDQEPLAIK